MVGHCQAGELTGSEVANALSACYKMPLPDSSQQMQTLLDAAAKLQVGAAVHGIFGTPPLSSAPCVAVQVVPDGAVQAGTGRRARRGITLSSPRSAQSLWPDHTKPGSAMHEGTAASLWQGAAPSVVPRGTASTPSERGPRRLQPAPVARMPSSLLQHLAAKGFDSSSLLALALLRGPEEAEGLFDAGESNSQPADSM